MNIPSRMSFLGRTPLTLVLLCLMLLAVLQQALVRSLEAQVSSRLARARTVSLAELYPPPSDPLHNAAVYYDAALKMVRGGVEPQESWKRLQSRNEPGFRLALSDDPEDGRRVLEANAPVLALIEQANRTQGCCSMGFVEPSQRVRNDNIMSLIRVTELLQLQCEVAAAREDWPGANHAAVLGLRLVRRFLPNEALLMLAVRRRCSHSILTAMQTFPTHLSPEAREEARELALVFASSWVPALQAERVHVISYYDQIRLGQISLSSLAPIFSRNWGRELAGVMSLDLYRLGGAPLLLADEMAYLDWSQAAERSLYDPVSVPSCPGYCLIAGGFEPVAFERIAEALRTEIGQLKAVGSSH